MKRFLSRHASKITGVLSGFDRLVLRGSLRRLSYLEGMRSFLWRNHILLKEFGDFAKSFTARLRAASVRQAEERDRPVRYLPSSHTSKEEVARQILAEQPVRSGLICVLSCVEPCMSYEIYRNREKKLLELQPRQRKGLFLYHYFLHPQFGFMHARIQTWLPCSIQICLNGREWLAREMHRVGQLALRDENCFTWLGDPAKAQALMDQQLRIDWPLALNRIAREVNPEHELLFQDDPQEYYWSVRQSEWATDLLFEDSDSLARIYPRLVHHAISSFASRDVMRFLGKRVHGAFEGQIVSDFKDRPEGVRVKHRVQNNSVKAYDKKGSVLRIETTINDPNDLKVYRCKEGDPRGEKAWRPLRRGIADLHRRAEISQASNERYLEALAAVECSTPLRDLLARVGKPTKLGNQRIRALRPWDEDELALLEAVGAGEFLINGLRNRNLVDRLFPRANRGSLERKRLAAKITRRLRILRAHHIIRKVQGTHRYLVTDAGRELITALLAARQASVSHLLEKAA